MADQGHTRHIDRRLPTGQIDDGLDPTGEILQPGIGADRTRQGRDEHGVAVGSQHRRIDVSSLPTGLQPGGRDGVGGSGIQDHGQRRRPASRACGRKQQPAGERLAVRSGVGHGLDPAPGHTVERRIDCRQGMIAAGVAAQQAGRAGPRPGLDDGEARIGTGGRQRVARPAGRQAGAGLRREDPGQAMLVQEHARRTSRAAGRVGLRPAAGVGGPFPSQKTAGYGRVPVRIERKQAIRAFDPGPTADRLEPLGRLEDGNQVEP